MSVVNLDFTLINEDGSEIGNCAEFVSSDSYNEIVRYMYKCRKNGQPEIADAIKNARDDWAATKETTLEEPEFSYVKNFFENHSGLMPSPRQQILDRFGE